RYVPKIKNSSNADEKNSQCHRLCLPAIDSIFLQFFPTPNAHIDGNETEQGCISQCNCPKYGIKIAWRCIALALVQTGTEIRNYYANANAYSERDESKAAV